MNRDKEDNKYLGIITNEGCIVVASIREKSFFHCPSVDDLRPIQLWRAYVESFPNNVRSYKLNDSQNKLNLT